MTSYLVKYTRLKPRKELEASVTTDTMDKAVEKVVSPARKQLIDLSDISVRLNQTEKMIIYRKGEYVKSIDIQCNASQKYCDTCLIKQACYGVNNKWYCNECK